MNEQEAVIEDTGPSPLPGGTGQAPGRRLFDVGGEVAVLEFSSDHPLHGAEIRCTLDKSIEEIFAMQNEIDEIEAEAEDDDETTDETKIRRQREGTSRLMDVLRRFGDEILIGWNLSRNGQPLPATGEGFVKAPVPTSMRIMRAYFAAVFSPSKSD